MLSDFLLRRNFLDQQSSSILPTSFSDLVLWVDADDLSTLFKDSTGFVPVEADNDPVGRWSCKVPDTSVVMQNITAGKYPLYKTNIQNGKPGILFDGSDDKLDASLPINLVDEITVLIVLKTIDNNAYSVPLHLANSSGDTYNIWISVNTSANNFTASVFDTGERTATCPGDPTGANIYGLSNTEGEIVKGYRNGALFNGAVAVGTWGAASGQCRLGIYRDGVQFPFSGYIHEVIIYKRVLSTQELSTLCKYLGKKWGISAVVPPVGNPLGISSGAFWIDCSRIPCAENSVVHLVPDLSGNGRHIIQNTLSLQGIFKLNIQNSLPGILMDSSDDFYALFAEVEISSEMSVFGVFKVVDHSPASAPMLWSFLKTGATEPYVAQMFYYPNNLSPSDQSQAVGWDGSSKDSVISGSPIGAHIFGMTEKEGDYLTAYFDNSVDATPTSIGTFTCPYSNTKGTIGANVDGLSRWMNGYILEILAWSKILSVSEISIVKDYLSTKWGISL